jgi:hypothetical protein
MGQGLLAAQCAVQMPLTHDSPEAHCVPSEQSPLWVTQAPLIQREPPPPHWPSALQGVGAGGDASPPSTLPLLASSDTSLGCDASSEPASETEASTRPVFRTQAARGTLGAGNVVSQLYPCAQPQVLQVPTWHWLSNPHVDPAAHCEGLKHSGVVPTSTLLLPEVPASYTPFDVHVLLMHSKPSPQSALLPHCQVMHALESEGSGQS